MREKQRKTCVSSQRPELLIFSENSILRYVFVQKQAISKSISLKHENTGFRRMTLGMCVCVVLLLYIRLPGSFFGAHKVVCLYIIRYTRKSFFCFFVFVFIRAQFARSFVIHGKIKKLWLSCFFFYLNTRALFYISIYQIQENSRLGPWFYVLKISAVWGHRKIKTGAVSCIYEKAWICAFSMRHKKCARYSFPCFLS